MTHAEHNLLPIPARTWSGWRVDFKLLQAIAAECETQDDSPSLETVEAVILELAKRGHVKLAWENETVNQPPITG